MKKKRIMRGKGQLSMMCRTGRRRLCCWRSRLVETKVVTKKRKCCLLQKKELLKNQCGGSGSRINFGPYSESFVKILRVKNAFFVVCQ